MSAWQEYTASLKSSFGELSAESVSVRLDASVVKKAGQATSPEVARRACVKHATSFVQSLIPFLHQTWTSYDVVKKIEVVRLKLDPIKNACRLVDQTLTLSSNAEKEFLMNAEKLLLSDDLIEELREWARQNLESSSRSDTVMESDQLAPHILAENLRLLGWNKRLEICFTEVCYNAVRKHLKQFCSLQFEEPMLALMLGWGRRVPGPWLLAMVGSTDSPAEFEEKTLRRLEFDIYQAFGDLRENELFDIVAAFPSSESAVDDLKRCLSRTKATSKLLANMNESLKRRLLHGGANTNSILLVFVRLIKTMRRLDPTGVLLETVAEPVKAYLRTRPETIRCIVTALTNDGGIGGSANAELYDELGLETDSSIGPIDFDMMLDDDVEENALDGAAYEDGRVVEYQDLRLGEIDPQAEGPLVLANTPLILAHRRSIFEKVSVEDMRAMTIPAEFWDPDPIEANPNTSSKSRISNDIFGNLIRIYGSKDMFVNEYRQMLSERLLTKIQDFDIDGEVRRLELLKLRFGDAAMLTCDVMLRDIGESRRANQAIWKDLKRQPFETMVLSRHFWPQFSGSGASSVSTSGENDPAFHLHPEVKKQLDLFSDSYAKYKKPRRLVYAPQLGTVDIRMIFKDGSSKEFFNLTTFLANMTVHFCDRSEWALSDLSRALGVDPDQVKKKMAFWIAEGIVTEDKSVGASSTTDRIYIVSPSAPSGMQSQAEPGESDADDDEAVEEQELGDEQMELEAAQAQVRDKALLDFIVGMLTNLGASTLGSVHRNLQMFSAAMPHGYDRDEAELEAFLEFYVGEGHLDYNQDKYDVPLTG